HLAANGAGCGAAWRDSEGEQNEPADRRFPHTKQSSADRGRNLNAIKRLPQFGVAAGRGPRLYVKRMEVVGGICVEVVGAPEATQGPRRSRRAKAGSPHPNGRTRARRGRVRP